MQNEQIEAVWGAAEIGKVINAPLRRTFYLLERGLLPARKETAAQLAKRVQDLVGDKAVPGDYWKTATVAERQLLQGNYDAAAGLYQAAVLAAPLDHGSHESSYNQAKLLLDALGAPPGAEGEDRGGVSAHRG